MPPKTRSQTKEMQRVYTDLSDVPEKWRAKEEYKGSRLRIERGEKKSAITFVAANANWNELKAAADKALEKSIQAVTNAQSQYDFWDDIATKTPTKGNNKAASMASEALETALAVDDAITDTIHDLYDTGDDSSEIAQIMVSPVKYKDLYPDEEESLKRKRRR
jgi:hypothetical protein